MHDPICGPCNDQICDWMPCAFPQLCSCTADHHPASNPEGSAMTFQIPASKRSIDQNRFPFEDEFGNKHSVPVLKYLPVAAAELMEEGKTIAALITACETDEARKAIRALDGEQFAAFLEEWERVSEASTGESQGSAGS